MEWRSTDSSCVIKVFPRESALGRLGAWSAFIDDRLRTASGPNRRSWPRLLLTSCGPTETAGLKSLFNAYHPRVVAGRTHARMIEETCGAGAVVLTPRCARTPEYRFERDVDSAARAGPAAAAYQIQFRSAKAVLSAGRFPFCPTRRMAAEMSARSSRNRKTPSLDYLVALYRLGDVKPDLWLPAVAVDGQNANLYDREWQDLIAYNYRLGYHSLIGFIGERTR